MEQARHLADREPKKPKPASLRRAVSTAYYALFHMFIAEAVKNWKRQHERVILARMFDHTPMRKACVNKRDELRSLRKTQPLTSAQDHLLRVAETFVDLQEQRHAADYDGAIKWTRTETRRAVEASARAFSSWKAIQMEPAAQSFLASLLLRDR